MQVLDIVADKTPDIVNMGVPIPEHIPFDLDNVIPKDHDRKQYNATRLSEFTMDLMTSMKPETSSAPCLRIPLTSLVLALSES